jgi:hypothetical protein
MGPPLLCISLCSAGDYPNDADKFRSVAVTYPDGNFLVLPARGNNVRIIHHCFVHGEPGSPPVVVGISRARKTSLFKTMNVNHAVIPVAEPRATRRGKNVVSFLPSMKEFLGCESASDFKSLTIHKEDLPASHLWGRAQSFWLHRMIFEITGGNSTQQAANLALAVMQELSGSLAPEEETESESRAKEVHDLLLFLWAVKKSWTSKVGLTDPPNLELFDS